MESQFTEELRLIKRIFGTFTTAYLTKAIVSIFECFVYPSNAQMTFVFATVYSVGPILWDLAPIGLILYYNLKNFSYRR